MKNQKQEDAHITKAHKKVCILTTVHSPFDVRIFHKEASSLVNAGYDVTLIACHDKSEVIDGVKIINLRNPINRFERMTKVVWSAYKKAIVDGADIYHLHDPELLPIGLLLKLQGKKIIYDMHENLPKDILDKDWIFPILRRILAPILSLLERVFLIATPIIFAEQSYRKDYPWVNKYECVLNMPILSKLLDLKNHVTLKQRHTIGYIGSISDERCCFEIIEALKILKDRGYFPRFECVGAISGQYKKKLMLECSKYGLQSVIYHGYLPAEQGWSIISKCAVGLAILHPRPNFYESYPTKMFEYMAMGLPIIASNFPLYQSIINKNKCGICVDPQNSIEIADAISWIFDNPNEAEIMGARGRKAVAQNYNWDIESNKLISFYETL